MSSIPYKNGQASDIFNSFKASCGHDICSSQPAIKPEIILRYPLEDTKTLELNNLAASLCFPTGIKLCYSEKGPEEMVGDYVTLITDQKGERFYMMTFHFYLEMSTDNFEKKYNMLPEEYLVEAAMPLVSQSRKNYIFDFNDFAKVKYKYIPCCICLISKYQYEKQMKTCLESIYQLLIGFKEKDNLNQLNYLIMYLINSVPIPDVEGVLDFNIPHNDPSKNRITLTCPKLEDFKVKDNLYELFELFETDDIIRIFILLLLEKRILFVDDNYERLSKVMLYFTELLYPIEWVHTNVPVMSFDTIAFLQTFLPFFNGIGTVLLKNAVDQDIGSEIEEGMFVINIKEKKKSNICFYQNGTLISKNDTYYKLIPAKLKEKLKKNLGDIRKNYKKIKNVKKIEKNKIDSINLNIRDCFIEIFVEMFHNIKKYLFLLGDNVVVNKKLFLEKFEKESQIFINEIMEGQIFALFINKFVNEENNYKYFINKIENKNKTDVTPEKFVQKNKANKIYIINSDKLKIKENNIIINNLRIAKNIQEIDSVIKNFAIVEKNLCIYLIPEKNRETKKLEENIKLENKRIDRIEKIDKDKEKDYQILRSATVLSLKGKNEEKENEIILEHINDLMTKLFKSEEIPMDNDKKNVLSKSSKNDIQIIINTSEQGRKHFISLLSQNKSNVFLLEDKCFDILGELIYNTLIFLKQAKDNEEKIEQVIELTKSTKYFGKEEKKETKNSKKEIKNENSVPEKNILTLWDEYGEKIRDIRYFTESDFWDIYYNKLLKKE